LFRAEDRFCNKIIKCPQEVEVLNRVKQIPCRKILSRTYGHENKRSPFVGRKRERERERERENSAVAFVLIRRLHLFRLMNVRTSLEI